MPTPASRRQRLEFFEVSKFKRLSAKKRFTTLQNKDIDVLVRHTAWAKRREGPLGLKFSGTNFVESLGFMVTKSKGVGSAKELSNPVICTWHKNYFEPAVEKFFKSNNVSFEKKTSSDIGQALRAYDFGSCDVMPLERTGLGFQRHRMRKPDDHMILPDTLGESRLGPYVRANDSGWNDVIKWTLNALVVADEKGIAAANVDASVSASDGETRRLLSVEGTVCEDLGLPARCFYNVIRNVGNYSEMFARNVGPGTWMNLDQGDNKPESRGGKLKSFTF